MPLDVDALQARLRAFAAGLRRGQAALPHEKRGRGQQNKGQHGNDRLFVFGHIRFHPLTWWAYYTPRGAFCKAAEKAAGYKADGFCSAVPLPHGGGAQQQDGIYLQSADKHVQYEDDL